MLSEECDRVVLKEGARRIIAEIARGALKQFETQQLSSILGAS